MKAERTVTVGVRELKNRLTTYLRFAKEKREVIVTERGKPIAVIQPISSGSIKSLEAKIATLAAKGEITAPEKPLAAHLPRVKATGRALSEMIVADRR